MQIFALCLNVALCYVVNNPCHMTTDNVGVLLASSVESVKTVVEVTKDLRRSVNETLSLVSKTLDNIQLFSHDVYGIMDIV